MAPSRKRSRAMNCAYLSQKTGGERNGIRCPRTETAGHHPPRPLHGRSPAPSTTASRSIPQQSSCPTTRSTHWHRIRRRQTLRRSSTLTTMHSPVLEKRTMLPFWNGFTRDERFWESRRVAHAFVDGIVRRNMQHRAASQSRRGYHEYVLAHELAKTN